MYIYIYTTFTFTFIYITLHIYIYVSTHCRYDISISIQPEMIPRDLRIFQGRNQQGQRWPRSEARGAGNARCHGLAAAHGEAWRTAGAENAPGCNGLVKWVGKMGMSLEKDGYAIKSGFYSGSCSWPC